MKAFETDVVIRCRITQRFLTVHSNVLLFRYWLSGKDVKTARLLRKQVHRALGLTQLASSTMSASGMPGTHEELAMETANQKAGFDPESFRRRVLAVSEARGTS